MRMLGIETTCDETSLALVDNGISVVAHRIASQEAIHRATGGVVPSVAMLHHVQALPKLLDLLEEEEDLSKVDCIAVAHTPGLIVSIQAGLSFAQGLSLSLGKPIIGVNHVEAHAYSALMSYSDIQKDALLQGKGPYPALGVVISGGHTLLMRISSPLEMEVIGSTLDDAVGEALDKGARLLGLPYPGGRHLEIMAQQGNPFAFPCLRGGRSKDNPLAFSFSGIKTHLWRLLKLHQDSPDRDERSFKEDLAASYQRAIFEDIIAKIDVAIRQVRPNSIWFGGGVTQNCTLRTLIAEKNNSSSKVTEEVPILWPSPDLCSDNAVMIAGLGCHAWNEQIRLRVEGRSCYQGKLSLLNREFLTKVVASPKYVKKQTYAWSSNSTGRPQGR